MKIRSHILIPVFAACLCLGCGPVAPSSNNTATETPAPTVEVKKKTFDDDLASVKYNDYTWLFVLRRKDGKAFDVDDNKSLRAYTPPETNQRILSDDGKALIIGTNFRFYPGQWAGLNKFFDVQDLSAEKYVPNENDLPSANNNLGIHPPLENTVPNKKP